MADRVGAAWFWFYPIMMDTVAICSSLYVISNLLMGG